MADDENQSELLDEDKLPAEYPPERPQGVDGAELRVHGAEHDEPPAERVKREVPEGANKAADPSGPLVTPQEGGGADVTKEEVARQVGVGEPLGDEPASERSAVLSAEEEAVHRQDGGAI